MFTASPGHVLLAVDYNYIELCTLAASCEHRYGYSVLAEVIRRGIDPHAFTAAMFEGIELEEFMSWRHTEERGTDWKKLRQRAKAINFGIPGGLGSHGLKSYAKSGYGVDISSKTAQSILFFSFFFFFFSLFFSLTIHYIIYSI